MKENWERLEKVAENLSKVLGKKVALNIYLRPYFEEVKEPICLCNPKLKCPCPLLKQMLEIFGECWCGLFYIEE